MCHEHQGNAPGPVHLTPTTRRSLCYFFHPKHHNPNDPDESQWLLPPELTADEEFGVFDFADMNDMSDQKGHLYGIRVNDGCAVVLGTLGQKVARFWEEDPKNPWHGHPISPILSRRDRDKDLLRPVPKKVLLKIRAAGVITPQQFSRLKRGK